MTLTEDPRTRGPAGGGDDDGGRGPGAHAADRADAAARRDLPAGRGVGGEPLVEAALVAVIATLVGLAFRPVFAPEPVVALAVGGALGAVVVSTLATRLARWPASGAALASLAAAPAVLGALAWRSVPTPSAWAEVARAVTAAPSRILSAPLPAPDRPELLVLVAASAWVTGHVAAELAARTRAPLAPLAPVAPALAVPLLLGVGGPRPGVAVVGGLAVAGGALALVRASALPPTHAPNGRGAPASPFWRRSLSLRQPTPPEAEGPRAPRVVAGPGARAARRRRLGSAVLMVAVAGLVPALAGDALPLAAREPRVDLRGPVTDTAPQLRSPLVEVSAQRLAATPEVAFTARGPDGIELWRTAVLDAYDGATWRSSGVYEPVGSRLPEAAAPGEGPPAGVDVTVGALAAPFVPLPGRAVRVDGVEGRFDAATGVLLADEPLADGTAYSVDAAVGPPSDAALDAAERDRHGPDAAVARRPVPDAAALSEIAGTQVATRTAGLTGTADVRQLRALQEFFADQGRFRLATTPVGGLSLRHLTSFVGTAAQGGVSEGSIEQFAAAYAVMARTLGYPTRVAVGYRTLDATGGSYEVENRDAFAWAEVKLTGVGWVPFVAAPVTTEEAPPPPPQTAPVPTTTTPPPPSSLPDADRPDDTPDPAAPTDAGGGSPPWVALALVVAGLALVVGAAGAPAVRARRRRRRRRGAPAASIDGAWRETLDGLAAYRYPVTRAMTAPEVLAVAADHAGAPVPAAAGDLARLANEARYGPAASPPEAAGDAWRRSAEVLAWARGPLSPRVRARPSSTSVPRCEVRGDGDATAGRAVVVVPPRASQRAGGSGRVPSWCPPAGGGHGEPSPYPVVAGTPNVPPDGPTLGPEPMSRRATPRPWARLAGRAAVACVVVGAAVAGLTASGLPSAPAALVDGDAWLVHGRDLVHASSQGSAADWMLPDALAAGAEAAAVAEDGDLTLVVDVSGERAFSLDAVTLEASDPVAVDPDVRPYVGGGQAYLVGDGQVRWLDPATFEVERSFVVPGSVSATIDGDGILWVLSPRDGSLRRVVRGEVTAEVPVVEPGHDAAVTLAGNQPVVHDRDGGRLYFVDRRTGRRGDDIVLPGPATLQGPSQEGDRVWLAADDGTLLGIRPDGDAIEVEVPDVTGALRRPEVTGDRVVVPSDGGRVAVFDSEGQPVGAAADLPAAALGDFHTFTKDGVVWFNAPASGQAGTVDGEGAVHPIDVDEGDLTRRREQTPDPEAPVEPTRVDSAPLPELPQAPVPATIPATPPPPPSGPSGPEAPEGGPTTTAAPTPGGPGGRGPASSTTTSTTSPAASSTTSTTAPASTTTTTAPPTTTTTAPPTTTTTLPQSVPVPDVAGRPVTEACATIEAAGLACDPQDAGQYGAPANTVLGQAPVAGTSLARGGTVAVSYYASEGMVVPQAGADRSTACGPLEAAGLVCSLVPVEGGDYPTPDEVYGQSVAPGTRVGPGSTVSVQVESRQAADVWQLDNPANQQLYLTTDAGLAGSYEAQGWRRTNLGRIFLAPAPGTGELDCFEPDGTGSNQSRVYIQGPLGPPPYLQSCGVLGYFPIDGHPKEGARSHDVWDYVAHSDHLYSTSGSDPLGLELEALGPPNYHTRAFGLFN